MSLILTAIGLVFTAVMGYFAQIAALFTDTPILQLGLAMMVIGFVVGILQRLIRV